MRSNLFSSILMISLGLGMPIVSAIGFPEVAVAQSAAEQKTEANNLLSQCFKQFDAKKYQEASQSCERALAIYRNIRDRKGESVALMLIGTGYISLGEYAKAVEYFELNLVISRDLKDQNGEDITITSLAFSYNSLKNYPKAIEYLEKSLPIYQKSQNQAGENVTINSLAVAYSRLQNYPKAIEYLEKALPIYRKLQDKSGELSVLNLLGEAYVSLTNYTKAVEHYETVLSISRENKNLLNEGVALERLGSMHMFLGDYSKSLNYHQRSLDISRELKNQVLEGYALSSLGIFYHYLGDYPKAIEYQQKSLKIFRETNNRLGEGNAFLMLGLTYYNLKEYEKSIENYEQSLAISVETKDGSSEASAIGNIGFSHRALGNYSKAIEYHRKSLDVSLKNKVRVPEAYALGGLGWDYQSVGDYPKALYYYEQALAIAREMKSPDAERLAFSKIASVFQDQKKPDLAIAYYRQSIKASESIRQSTRALPKNLQSSYTQVVSETYRDLASLLISQGRNGEAQQVIELLKVQDLNEFAAATRSTIPSIDGSVSTSAPAVQVEINTLMAFGKTLDDCRRSNCSSLSSLESQYQDRRTAAEQNIKQIEANAKNNPSIAGRTADFTQSADKLANRPNTAVIYPLVTTEGVQLLWMTQGKVNGSATCPMPKAKLNDHISTFRTLIANRDSNVNVLKSEGKILYDCLIAPLDAAFKANKITNIIFIPDLTTSYIPLAALHDGTNYLIDRYTISNALSAELTDTTDRLSTSPSILGLGLTDAYPGYMALPNVQHELDSIVKTTATSGIFPGTTFLNDKFTLNTLNGDNQKNLRDRKILHIATHGEFLPTDPRSSYLLLGNGARFPIYQIQDLDALRNTHLVVLSACKTGVSGKDANGIEVGGIYSYFLRDRAKAVLASLWNVDDASTSLLMQNFYQNLATGMSKPAALRQAQLNLLTQKITPKTASERSGGVRLLRSPGSTASDFAHPYFWAPFTLTGNPN
jgi:CHAT domain-containing protein/Tfp pilus assembly protein PilF